MGVGRVMTKIILTIFLFISNSFAMDCKPLSQMMVENRYNREVYRFEECDKGIFKTTYNKQSRESKLSTKAIIKAKSFLTRMYQDAKNDKQSDCSQFITITKFFPQEERVEACLHSKQHIYEQFQEMFYHHHLKKIPKRKSK